MASFKISNRYAFEDSLTLKTYIEFNLQKVRILTIPDWSGHTEFEVFQFSKNDTVSDLYNRLIDPAETESKMLLKVIEKRKIFALQSRKLRMITIIQKRSNLKELSSNQVKIM